MATVWEPSYGPSAGADVADLDAARAQIQRLQDELARAERAESLALDLVADQERRLAEVRALADLADWALSAAGTDDDVPAVDATVRVSDLRRALR